MNHQLDLSPRLRMLADLVPPGVRLADIGTDHAYLPAALLLENKIASAIAADVRPGPLSRAEATVHSHVLAEKIQLRLCDGLSGIEPEEVDAITIAGMGGETIASILSAAPWTRHRGIPLLLQPMSSQRELRRWLIDNGYQITEEQLAQEGETIYLALLVKEGIQAAMSPAELWVGRNNNHPLRGLWLEGWLKKTKKALLGLERARAGRDSPRYQELEQVQAGLQAMKKEWDTWR